MSSPHIETRNGKKVFVVNGKPMILIAGEVHNSNSSNAVYMEGVWEKAQTLKMNTLLLPFAWETAEPEEGVYDFSLPAALIQQARERGMKILFLWFGCWKNAECMYAPSWVKADLERFPRAQIVKGKNKSPLVKAGNRGYTSLSYLSEEAISCDRRAFVKFMEFLKETDSQEQTVVAVQVENETGILGAGREHSDAADAVYEAPVPTEFYAAMKQEAPYFEEDIQSALLAGNASTWEAAFGPAAEEIFSAYHIAKAVGSIAAAGKEVYDIPMTVNCWLRKPGDLPGDYPSGGPVERMFPVWRYLAPAIDVLCPDIYVPYFCNVCDSFTKDQNPLLIPESAAHSYAGARLVYTIGHYHAMGFSPFGFEDMGAPVPLMQGFLFGMDDSDPALKTMQDIDEYAAYAGNLQSLMPLILPRYGTGELQAVCAERKDEAVMNFGEFCVSAVMDVPFLSRRNGVALGIKTSEDSCYLLVNQCVLQVTSNDPERPNLDYLDLEEGYLEDGNWVMTRRLNGDESTMMLFTEVTLLRMRVLVFSD